MRAHLHIRAPRPSSFFTLPPSSFLSSSSRQQRECLFNLLRERNLEIDTGPITNHLWPCSPTNHQSPMLLICEIFVWLLMKHLFNWSFLKGPGRSARVENLNVFHWDWYQSNNISILCSFFFVRRQIIIRARSALFYSLILPGALRQSTHKIEYWIKWILKYLQNVLRGGTACCEREELQKRNRLSWDSPIN